MCIPNDEECPINNITLYIKSSPSPENDYTLLDNKYIKIKTDNKDIKNNIIVDISLNNGTMNYINKDNFIFDNKTFEEYYKEYSENYNIYGNTKVNNYINNELSNESNIINIVLKLIKPFIIKII
jgi:hypothetical protein